MIMNNTKNIIKLFIGGLYCIILLSCEEVINPNLISDPPILSVDGWLLDLSSESRIILSKTAPFNSQTPNPPVSNALVKIKGGPTTFIFPEDPDNSGHYAPLSTIFKTDVGVKYTLTITTEGTDYEAEIRTRFVPVIDSISSEFQRFSQEPQRTGQYITFYFKDPPNTRNYYYWEVFRNGELISGGDINIKNDENLDGMPFPIPVPYKFSFKQIAEVRLHALTEDAYNYYKALKLLVDSGSPSQSIPENPITNVFDISTEDDEDKRLVVGYFNATTTSSYSIEIPE